MTRISFKDLHVQTLSHSSGIFSGTNIHVGFRSMKKQNEGNGTISGNRNVVMNNTHVVQKQNRTE